MIKVSDTASKKIISMMQEDGFDAAKDYVRVGVKSGGCSGLSYDLKFDKEIGENDKIFEDNNVKIAVEKKSFLYLAGTILEFSGGLNGKGFVFNNPNAQRTCGCGESSSLQNLKIEKLNDLKIMTKSFEEFEVHKKGVLLTKQVFKLLNNSSLEKEFGFKDQIKRAVISITNNIAEGSEYNNNKQFIRYLKIAKGSCAEVRNMLLLAKELEFCTEKEMQDSFQLTIEISQNISNFIKYLDSKLEK